MVDGGSFDWERSGKFAELTAPYDGFHNMVFSEESHRRRLPAARAPRGPARLRRLHEPAHRLADPAGHRDAAAAHGAPHDNTRKVVEFLAAHPFVAQRRPSDAANRIPAMRWRKSCCPKGAGSVFSFDIKGNREQGKKFIEALKLFSHLANVGDCRSLVIHPASTTHFRMSDEALAGAGITQGTIRLSIGLEDPGRPDRRPQARAEGGGEG